MVVHYTNCHLVTWWPTSLFAHTVKLRSVCSELCNLCNTLTKVCKCAADEVFIVNHVMYSVLCVIYIVQCCWDFLFCRECRICSSTLLHTETDSINIVRLSWESWISALNFDQFLQKTLEINQKFHFNSVPFGCYQRKQMCNEASSLRKHMRTLLILIPQSFRGPACCRP